MLFLAQTDYNRATHYISNNNESLTGDAFYPMCKNVNSQWADGGCDIREHFSSVRSLTSASWHHAT